MLSGTSAGAAWSLQRSRATSLGGEVLSSPVDAPASPSANTTLNTHAIVLGASSLTSAAVRRWRFYVPVHKISHRYFQPGCGRSWLERAKRHWCHQVCRRPPRRVEKASLMSLPGAPELKMSTAGQNVFDPHDTFEIHPAVSVHKFHSNSTSKNKTGPPIRGSESQKSVFESQKSVYNL
jgi:hypothetical protein